MKLFLFLATVFFLNITAIAQEEVANDVTKVEYEEYINGKLNENSTPFFTF